MSNIPENLKYTKDHEWVLVEGDTATVGVTFHAQDELTDVVYVELPEIDREVEAEEATAVVESVKAASDIYSPLTGTILEANETLNNEPGTVNTSPYEDGWIFKVKLSDPAEVESLMTPSAYAELIGQA